MSYPSISLLVGIISLMLILPSSRAGTYTSRVLQSREQEEEWGNDKDRGKGRTRSLRGENVLLHDTVKANTTEDSDDERSENEGQSQTRIQRKLQAPIPIHQCPNTKGEAQASDANKVTLCMNQLNCKYQQVDTPCCGAIQRNPRFVCSCEFFAVFKCEAKPPPVCPCGDGGDEISVGRPGHQASTNASPTAGPSKDPSTNPSSIPSNTPSENSSTPPSDRPSQKIDTLASGAQPQASISSVSVGSLDIPSALPSISSIQTTSSNPSRGPSGSSSVSSSPSVSTRPSASSSTSPSLSSAPSLSNKPSIFPTTDLFLTARPTSSTIPSVSPSITPSSSLVPSGKPSDSPSNNPTGTSASDVCGCKTNDDCQKPVCEVNPISGIGFCVANVVTSSPSFGPSSAPSLQPSHPPSLSDVPSSSIASCCLEKRKIPTECEVQILINLLNVAVAGDHKLAPQWLRLAFHDAGTYNQHDKEGGANGCIMNLPDMRHQSENLFLDLPLNTLDSIKNTWEAHPSTCIDVSSADIIQFSAFFASIRQVVVAPATTPGLTNAKIERLVDNFVWGRPDEKNCKKRWTENLPGFQLGNKMHGVPHRCLMAGKEIKNKMIEKNGFTPMEATALIGAHTIGLTRQTFGDIEAGPWVKNGADDATTEGPVFDNKFFSFLEFTIAAETMQDFNRSIVPFSRKFHDWFRDDNTGLNHLDTDIALAFPSQNTDVHPDYHQYTKKFTRDNAFFLNTFFDALHKMSKLGVDDKILSGVTPCDPCVGGVEITVAEVVELVRELGGATAKADASLSSKQSNRKDEIISNTVAVEGKGTEFDAADVADPSPGVKAFVEFQENIKDQSNANSAAAVIRSPADKAVVVNLATVKSTSKLDGAR